MTPVIEIERKKRQEIVDLTKSKIDRNIFGQFSTPYPLACEIIYAIKNITSKKISSFLEPALGTGVFYSAFIEKMGYQPNVATGYEIDREYALQAKEIWNDYTLDVQINDFLETSPSQKYDLLVTNPPYSRHHHIPADKKLKFKKMIESEYGITISGLAGLYCYFLIISTKWLKENGLSVWLIPSEFMDVNYGKGVKEFLAKKVELLHIHRFLPEDVQFTDALVTSSIVIFRNSRPGNHKVLFSEGGRITDATHKVLIENSQLVSDQKWSLLFSNGCVSEQTETTPKLGDYFRVSRGIATGDNKFFIIDEETKYKYSLPDEFLRPMLPAPRFLNSQDISKTASLYLFSCNLPEMVLQEKYPSTWHYIQEGLQHNVDKGYICKQRNLWYSIETKNIPCFVIPYMGRGESERAFRFILNSEGKLITNSYLGLYPKPSANQIVNNQALLNKILSILNDVPIEEFFRAGRVYGGGLRKIEPKELMNLPVPDLSEVLHVDNLFSNI